MKPGTLVITIPAHVAWSQVGNKTQIRYNVEFSTGDNQIVDKATGTCFEDSIAVCAAAICERAKIVANRI